MRTFCCTLTPDAGGNDPAWREPRCNVVTPIARRLADAGQLSPRLVDQASEILSSDLVICRLLQGALGCGEGQAAKMDPTETATSQRMKRWSVFTWRRGRKS